MYTHIKHRMVEWFKRNHHRYRECIKKQISSRIKHPLLGIHKNRFLVTNSYYDILTPCLRSSAWTFLMSTVWVSTPSFSNKKTVRRDLLPLFSRDHSESSYTFVGYRINLISVTRIVSSGAVDPEWFVSDPTPDPDLTFKEVLAPTPDPDPVSDPATLVFSSANSHFIREITTIHI